MEFDKLDLERMLQPEYEVHLVLNKEKRYTKAIGNTPSLLTALSVYVEALNEQGIDKKLIEHAVSLGLKDGEKLRKDTKEKLQKLLEKLF